MTTTPALDDALGTTASWDVGFVSCAVHDSSGRLGSIGDDKRVMRIASVSKPLVGYAICIAVEEGTLSLDAPLGVVDGHPVNPELTIRHLLAHAGGYNFDGPKPLTAPGTRRMYSNTGFDLLGAALSEAAGMPVARYIDEAVFAPLGMANTELRGSPAKDVWSNVRDLGRFLDELLRPTLISDPTFVQYTAVQWPDLAGIVPGLGSYDPCPWGLGVEVRGHKAPHWSGLSNSPGTFGHFGGSGTFLWVDVDAVGGPLAAVCLTDREFGPWSLVVWPALSDAILRARSTTSA